MRPVTSRSLYSGREPATRRLLLAAGGAYGLAYSVSFALLTWGTDFLALSSVSADLAWGKLALGLPLTLLICVVVGRYSVSVSPLLRLLVVWPLTCALVAAFAAHSVLGISNALVWVVDSRFSRLPVFIYGRPDAVRTGFVVVVHALLGATVGLVHELAVDWAWDRGTPAGRMSLRSWLVMLVCIPLAVFPAVTLNEFVHNALRQPQQALGDYLDLATTTTLEEAEEAGISLHAVRVFQEGLSRDYVTYLAGFGPGAEGFYSASVDATFSTGLVLRCLAFGDRVVQCKDLSAQLTTWMDDLIHAGLGGARRWEETATQELIVPTDVVAWLTSEHWRMGDEYTVSRVAQRGGWIVVTARFDSGFDMACYFRGARPVVVDRCGETRFLLRK